MKLRAVKRYWRRGESARRPSRVASSLPNARRSDRRHPSEGVHSPKAMCRRGYYRGVPHTHVLAVRAGISKTENAEPVALSSGRAIPTSIIFPRCAIGRVVYVEERCPLSSGYLSLCSNAPTESAKHD